MFLIDRNYQQQRLQEKRENLSRKKRVSNRLEKYKRLKLERQRLEHQRRQRQQEVFKTSMSGATAINSIGSNNIGLDMRKNTRHRRYQSPTPRVFSSRANVLNEKKIQHRQKCLSRLPSIRKIPIKEFGDKTNIKETVFIEFRILPHTEYLIRNTIIKLNDWNHTIVCGNNNYASMKTICNNIHADTSSKIKIIKLDIANLIQTEYSKLLLTKSFWENFTGEKLLIYQEDSMLFHNNIQPFLHYDYVGAPWKRHPEKVGNGGFSLRSKSIMKKCIEKSRSLQNNYSRLPEDIFFCRIMQRYNIGKIAPYNIANQFSQEGVLSVNPLGGHAFWIAGNNLDHKW